MSDARILKFVNPATQEVFGEIPMCTKSEVEAAMLEMRRAAGVWSSTPVQERIRILRKLQHEIIAAADEITAVMTQDTGKSRQDALAEVFMTVDMLHLYLRRAPHWLRRRRISSGIFFFKRITVEPRPYGVVAVIAPWNYPFALAMPPVLSALLAGNTVLLKPSEVTGATGLLIERLFERVPELTPYVRVLHGDGEVGEALVRSRPDFIFLTGSTATGRKVMQAAAEYLIPTACELGGKDAMIVLEDADLDAAAHWGVWGAFYNTGQTCMSVERVYVVKEVYDEFLKRVLDAAARLKVGYTTDIRSPYYMGPITDPRQFRTIQRHLDDALAKGARLLTGGEIHGMFIEPAVLVDVDHNMLLMQEETFGPLLPIMKVDDEEQAVRLANDSHFGLSASVWSQDIRRAERVADRIQAGSVVVNDTIAQFAIPMLPFGGVKQSGTGRTHGKVGLLQFTLPKAVVTGQPPYPWDLATVARKPGNYRLVQAVMNALFGVTPAQKLQPLAGMLSSGEVKLPSRRTGAALGALGALTAAMVSSFLFFRRGRRS